MNRFATSLITKPVLLNKEQALVGFVEDLVIDPDNGNFVGILIREGFGKKNIKAVSAKDIIGIADKFLLVNSLASIGDLDEIIRIKTVLDKNIKIIKSKVYTVSGKYLGKVYDFTFDIAAQNLAKIFVKPHLFQAFSSDYIISFKQIIAIEKDKIIVEDGSVNMKQTSKALKVSKTAKPEIGCI